MEIAERAEEVGDALRRADATVATAESATGGLVSSAFTDVAGASDFFDGGIVTYSYGSKLRLGVSRESLDSDGAVSESVAREMAASIRDKTGVDWGVATTGIAGPTGGKDEKGIGTVFVGVAYRGDWGTDETYTKAERFDFGDDDRQVLKLRFADAALRMLHDEIG